MKPTRFPFLAAALLTLVVLGPTARAATLAEAMSAYRNNRVIEAEAMLEELAEDPAVADADRSEARRELARIAWLVRGETEALAAALALAPTGEARCATLALALRIYREANTPFQGVSELERGRGQCAQASSTRLGIEIAQAHLAAARLTPAGAPTHLRAAAAELAAFDALTRRTPSVAAANLALALAQADPVRALEAWRDYFWLDDADAPQALSAYAGRVGAIFSRGLRRAAREADRIALVDMLIRAGFADEAKALAGPMSDASGWSSARAYFNFRHAVRGATLRANREMASGSSAEWYAESIQDALQSLLREAGLVVEPSEDRRVALQRTLSALTGAYGLFGSAGRTGGYSSLHLGHVVQDEALAVEQYGRSARIRFIVIDNLLSNGFESWLWDGWAEAGGWSGGGTIVQVRSAYADGPLNALRTARPGPDRDRFIADIAERQRDEDAALRGERIGTLLAASHRLRLQVIDEIAANTRDDSAFVAEFWRATIDYSITLHEGRHALDQAAGLGLQSEELEYRAKLSQIALSQYPRLGLANVAGQTMGDTPHGAANRRVLEGFRSWMGRHAREIDGFSGERPALTQLHLLSDAQIRAAARSLDPWASISEG